MHPTKLDTVKNYSSYETACKGRALCVYVCLFFKKMRYLLDKCEKERYSFLVILHNVFIFLFI